MRMIAGLEDPTEGEIWINDRCVNDVEPKDRDVAMVFQSYGLYPNMTVRENIAFPLRIRGLPVVDIDAAVFKAAQRVELVDFLNRRPKELSGGQRQRVALARAIVRKPAVFLMDEPLSNLDAQLRSSMRAHLRHLHLELGATTVYVTHDQVEAMTLADRVVVMSKAQVQQIGTPEQIYNAPANLFVAGFVGSPPMNLIPGRLEAGVFLAPGVEVKGLWPHFSGNVVLGVRAEDLDVVEDGSGEFQGSVYACELTGDASWLTLQIGNSRVTAKINKAHRARIHDQRVLTVLASNCHLFEAVSQERLQFST